jgi:uncharacterized membrane protein YgcG
MEPESVVKGTGRITCAGNPVYDRETLNLIRERVSDVVKVLSRHRARIERSLEKYENQRELSDYN